MGNIFEFHWHTNNLLFPILMALSFDGRYISTLYLKNKNPIILSFLMFSGQIFSGILAIIVLFRSKMRKKKKKENNDEQPILGINPNIIIQHEKSDIKNSRWDILIFFSISVLDYLSFILLNQNILINLALNLRIIQIFFISLFAFFILKTRLFKHNLVSLILIVMGVTGLTYFEFKLELWKYFLFYLAAFFCNSLRIVLIKVLMEKWYYLPYFILPIIGTTGMICLFASLPLFPLVGLEGFSFHESIKEPLIKTFKDIYQILFFFAIFICGLLFGLFGTLTNFHFTPCHVGIGDTLSSLILLVMLKWGHPSWEIVVSLICNSIILIGVIIYTEILVINLCGLNKFTNREIQKRAEEKENTPSLGTLIPQNNDIQSCNSKLSNQMN